MESQLPKSTVYFDGSCPLCRAEIGYYQRKDQYGAFCFVDISEPGGIPPEGITQEHAMKRFHVRASDGRVLSGAAALSFARPTPLPLPIFPARPPWASLGLPPLPLPIPRRGRLELDS